MPHKLRMPSKAQSSRPSQLSQPSQLFVSFRNALLNVAMDADELLPIQAQVQPGSLHVLVVDGDHVTCMHYWNLIESIAAGTRVHACQTANAALDYVREQNDAGTFINLVLFELDAAHNGPGPIGANPPGTVAQQIHAVAANAGGFDLPAQISAMYGEGAQVPIDFRFRPLVALISHAGNAIIDAAIQNGQMQPDGSTRDCDVVLQKPIALHGMRALLDCCDL